MTSSLAEHACSITFAFRFYHLSHIAWILTLDDLVDKQATSSVVNSLLPPDTPTCIGVYGADDSASPQLSSIFTDFVNSFNQAFDCTLSPVQKYPTLS